MDKRKKVIRIRYPVTFVLVMAVICLSAPLLIGSPALAFERSAVELCANGVDDDYDGFTDEEPCQAGTSVPVSGDGEIPELWYAGLMNCDDIGFGDLYGLKIDGTPLAATYPFVNDEFSFPPTVLDGGPEDPYNYVTISNLVVWGDNIAQFDWHSTLAVAAVIVKAQDSNVYVYTPADFEDTGLGAPYLDHQIASVEVCYSYTVAVEVTAETSFQREYTWTVDKTADQAGLSGFVGETLGTDYSVSVDRSFSDSGYTVEGTIEIYNPSALAVGFSVADVIEGGYAATVTCPATTIGAHETITCTYTVEVPDNATRLNTATVTTDSPDVPGNTGEALAVFGSEPTTSIGYPTVNVTDTNGSSWMVSDDAAWAYPATFNCPTDPALYIGGVYSLQVDNTVSIVETAQSNSEAVTITCYAPLVSSNAVAEYTRTYTWNIAKQASPNVHIGFLGNTFESNYVVAVDRTITDSGFTVYGTIGVANPHPSEPMTIGLSDMVGDVVATLDCGGTLVVPPAGFATCGYSAALGTRVDGTNTATALFNGVSLQATASWVFGDSTTVIGSPVVNVSDTNGNSWTASDDAAWTYPATFNCPTDPALYIGGVYSLQVDNTASIVETAQSDSEAVTVTCYTPLVSSDAFAGYTREYTWEIAKQASPNIHIGLSGDTFESDYVVAVDRTITDSGFTVYGTIGVANPHPSEPMTIGLSDMVGDVVATLDCGGTLVVPPAGFATCGYSAALGGRVDGTNTATVLFNGVSLQATASWVLGPEPSETIGYPSVNVTDTNGNSWTASDDASWTYPATFNCPTDPALYVGGVYSFQVDNTASIVETAQSDSEAVTVTCYAPAEARVVKTTQEGPEEIGQLPFMFELYAPDGTLIDTITLNAAGEAVFSAALQTTGTWTVKEIVPAGWSGEPMLCEFEVAYPLHAGTTFTCTSHNVEKGRVELVKLVNGLPADTEWVFALYAGSAGFGTEPVATVTVPYDDEFAADLDLFGTYTLCELSLPDGWGTQWMIDTDGDGYADTIVTPYNPSEGEDLGHRCFEFGAGTAYPVPIGDILVFEIDNLDIRSPEEQIEDIQEFFDDSVTSGTLTGVGATPTAATRRLNSIEDMLEQAEYLIDNGFILEACNQLDSIYGKTDSATPPPDFVSGSSAAKLAAQVLALMESLGCE